VCVFGSVGSGQGQLQFPSGMAFDDRFMYVTENGNNRIQVFSKNGSFVRRFGEPGSGPGQLRSPWRIACDGGLLYVADADNNRVQVLSCPDGKYVREWPCQGVTGLTVSEGFVYVTGIDTHLVSIFTTQGALIHSWGGFGQGEGKFHSPVGIGVDDSFIYVADSENHRVQMFDKEGKFVRYLDDHGQAEQSGTRLLAHPHDIAVVGDFVYTGDASNIVHVFTKDGVRVSQFGGTGEGFGQFLLPYTLAFDGEQMYIAEDGSHRIQVFE